VVRSLLFFYFYLRMRADGENSTAIGFVLSILATVLLFLAAIWSFARESHSFIHTPSLGWSYILLNWELGWTVLYTIGIIVSLIGTGFLIGVRCTFLIQSTHARS
jgi:hypothetical protein